MPGADDPFDPAALFERLARSGVDFVVIGAVAGGAHGSAYGTFNIDLAFADSPRNVELLARTLGEIDADKPFEPPTFACQTRLGYVKCFAAPIGARSYEALRADAWPIALRGVTVRVASLDHLIGMKEVQGRNRDKLLATEYRTISDELRAPRTS